MTKKVKIKELTLQTKVKRPFCHKCDKELSQCFARDYSKNYSYQCTTRGCGFEIDSDENFYGEITGDYETVKTKYIRELEVQE